MSEESVAGVDLKKQFKKGKKAKPDLLRKQDLATLDVNKLTPLSPEVISRQATINIGTIGHVAHGKSTIVRSISGVKTTKHSSEMVRNITIRLGYANGKIFQCQSEGCARPASFTSAGSSSTDTPPCEKCGAEMLLVRHVSFVDCFTTDHQILTSRGFMFMDEMRAALEEDPALLAASYDHETHELVYERPLKFVYNEPKEQKMVEFTQEAEKTRWDGASDGEDTNGLSLIVTPGHDMFAKTGRVCADDSMINWSKVTPVGDGADSKKRQINRDFDKLKAKDLINSDPKHAVQFLGIAEAGIRVEAEEEAAFMATLGLTTDAQADAFLRLYGFSLGNSGSASVLFSELKQQDLEYIRRQLAVLGLAPGSDYKEAGMSLEIVNQRWAGYFRSQCQAFQAWVWTLQKEKLRLIIEALCFADGEQAVKENAIYTSSAPFRDELVRVLLNAGYSPFFTAQDVAGTKSWKVSYAETAEDYTSPNLRSAKDTISEVDYSGATWCLSMPHGMVVVRRAVADECGVVTRASRPIITGNCPGHDILMATMLTGAAVMDAALLLVAANESCPQPQTSEHLAAIEIMKLKQIIILQNKIDLVKESAAIEQYKQILNFIEGTVADGSPIVPVSAQLGYNIDVLCEYIVNKIPVPTRDFLAPSRLIVIRSFDVNRPGTEIDDLQGGIAGGSLMQGVLKVGDEIEVRPGVVSTDKNGAFQCTPIFSKIVSLFAEENTLQYAVPGGLIGVGTRIDPTLCRADRLVGQVLGAVGTLPDIYVELEINFYLLRRLLGVKMDDERKAKVDKIRKGESLMINVGSTSTGGRVSAVKGDLAMVVLSRPVCTEVGEKVAISRRVAKHWRLIGWANIVAGKILEPSKPEEVSGTVVLENDKE